MGTLRGPRRRARAAAAATAAAVLLLAACSSGDGGPDDRADRSSTTSPTTAGSPSTAERTTTTTTPVETYTGPVDGFYEVPDPLPKAKPGTLIRTMDLGEADGQHTVRVMYHSRDARDRDRAVTGTVTYPTAPAPKGGWPVTSQANGTVGVSGRCAPSRLGRPAPTWGIEGVHADTDYIGMGPVGEIHPYLSGPSEGNSVIDAVRAARQLPSAHAGRRWFAVGHSQGGHGALFAGQRARAYAPELRLLGTVALAPATELTKTYGPLDEVVTRIVGVMMLYGAQGEYPDLRFDDYAGAQLRSVEPVFRTGCLDQIVAQVAGIPAETFYKKDPRRTEPTRTLLTKVNQPGLVKVPTPLYLAQGTDDDRVNVQRTRDFFARVCELGQVTKLDVMARQTHDSIVGAAQPAAARWMQDRLAGRPAPDDCPGATDASR